MACLTFAKTLASKEINAPRGNKPGKPFQSTTSVSRVIQYQDVVETLDAFAFSMKSHYCERRGVCATYLLTREDVIDRGVCATYLLTSEDVCFEMYFV